MLLNYWHHCIGGVNINKYQGSDSVILHCLFPIRADGFFCPFPHIIIVQFSLEGLLGPSGLAQSNADCSDSLSFLGQFSLPDQTAQPRPLGVPVSTCILLLHSFFPFCFRRSRARIMFKEKLGVCGTQCTACLGQEEKAKAIKLNKKGKVSAKSGREVSWKPDAVDFKKEKRNLRSPDQPYNKIEEETENAKMTLKRKAAKQCHGVSLLHSTFVSVKWTPRQSCHLGAGPGSPQRWAEELQRLLGREGRLMATPPSLWKAAFAQPPGTIAITFYCLSVLEPLRLMSSFIALMEVIKSENQSTTFLFSALWNQYSNGMLSAANWSTNLAQGWAHCPDGSYIIF